MANLIHVIIDRPLGFQDAAHPRYPLNYGYVKNVPGGDGMFQDAYIVTDTVNAPIAAFTGEKIAIVHRFDDVEDKWIVAASGERFTIAEIERRVHFMERYFKHEIILVTG